jgi:hypothetical protein
MKIDLGKHGQFLSGRSLPREIINQNTYTPGAKVELDFNGVVSCNQSFLNELFMALRDAGVGLIQVSYTNAPVELARRIQDEINRLEKIFQQYQTAQG